MLTLNAPDEGRTPPRRRVKIAENWYKALLKDILDAAAWAHWPLAAGGHGGVSGLPDRLALEPKTGRAWGFEVKGAHKTRDGWVPEKPRANQSAIAERWTQGGGVYVPFSCDTAPMIAWRLCSGRPDGSYARFIKRLEKRHG